MVSMGVSFVVPNMTLKASFCTLSSLSRLDCDRVVRPRQVNDAKHHTDTAGIHDVSVQCILKPWLSIWTILTSHIVGRPVKGVEVCSVTYGKLMVEGLAKREVLKHDGGEGGEEQKTNCWYLAPYPKVRLSQCYAHIIEGIHFYRMVNPTMI